MKIKLPNARSSICAAFSMVTAASAPMMLSACGTRTFASYDTQQHLPEVIRVPPGNKAVLEAQGKGNLLYECQAVKRTPFEYAWLLQNTSLQLEDSYGKTIVYYPGARARWVHSDGSQVLARKLVEFRGDNQDLPLQRATTESSPKPGALENISYVQNLRTHGGMVTDKPCTSAGLGMRVSVPYEADYVFWRSAT